MNVKVLGDRLLVKEFKDEGITKGGIVLVNPSNNKTTKEGKVVSVGNGRVESNGLVTPITDIKVDDKVLYTTYSGTTIKLDGEEYSILEHRDILAIIE